MNRQTMNQQTMNWRRRNGQIEFGETLMVVIILVFLLLIGFVFYQNAARASIAKEALHRGDVDAVILAKRVVALPELRCPTYDGGDGCIDKGKAAALAAMLNETSSTKDPAAIAYYEELFGYATLISNELDSAPSPLILYQREPVNSSRQPSQFIFATMHDPVTKKRNLVVLNVTRHEVRR